jgi:hypothetical protein
MVARRTRRNALAGRENRAQRALAAGPLAFCVLFAPAKPESARFDVMTSDRARIAA